MKDLELTAEEKNFFKDLLLKYPKGAFGNLKKSDYRRFQDYWDDDYRETYYVPQSRVAHTASPETRRAGEAATRAELGVARGPDGGFARFSEVGLYRFRRHLADAAKREGESVRDFSQMPDPFWGWPSKVALSAVGKLRPAIPKGTTIRSAREYYGYGTVRRPQWFRYLAAELFAGEKLGKAAVSRRCNRLAERLLAIHYHSKTIGDGNAATWHVSMPRWSRELDPEKVAHKGVYVFAADRDTAVAEASVLFSIFGCSIASGTTPKCQWWASADGPEHAIGLNMQLIRERITRAQEQEAEARRDAEKARRSIAHLNNVFALVVSAGVEDAESE